MFDVLRSVIATKAPSFFKALTKALPIPPAAPVISAFLFLNLCKFVRKSFFKLTQIRKRKKNQNFNLEIKFIKFSATSCGCSIKMECLTFDKITILELMISFAIFLL